MNKCLLALLLAVSGSAFAGHCDYPDQIASDGSICGGRAASVRPGGYTPPPEYAQPVAAPVSGQDIVSYWESQETPEQKAAEEKRTDERIARNKIQDAAMNNEKGLIVNTGKQRYICPTTGSLNYRTVEGELSEKADFIIVDGHKWYRQLNENGAIIYRNSKLSDWYFMVDKTDGQTFLYDNGNTGNAEQSAPCSKYEGGLSPDAKPENPIDAKIVALWDKEDNY